MLFLFLHNFIFNSYFFQNMLKLTRFSALPIWWLKFGTTSLRAWMILSVVLPTKWRRSIPPWRRKMWSCIWNWWGATCFMSPVGMDGVELNSVFKCQPVLLNCYCAWIGRLRGCTKGFAYRTRRLFYRWAETTSPWGEPRASWHSQAFLPCLTKNKQ